MLKARGLMVALALLTTPVLLVLPEPAQATEMCEIMDHDEWADLMDRIDLEIARFNLDGAKDMINRTHPRIPCLKTVVKPSYLARFNRQRIVVHFFKQEEDLVARWGKTDLYVMPDLPWPPDMPADHPIRAGLADLVEEAGMGGPPDKNLQIPKKGGMFVNGQPILTPEARLDMPNLVQVANDSGEIVDGYWQDGANFPAAYLTDSSAKLKVPKWFVPEDAAAAIAAAEARKAISEDQIAAADEADKEAMAKAKAEAEAAAAATAAAAAKPKFTVDTTPPKPGKQVAVDYSEQIEAWTFEDDGAVAASLKDGVSTSDIEAAAWGYTPATAATPPPSTGGGEPKAPEPEPATKVDNDGSNAIEPDDGNDGHARAPTPLDTTRLAMSGGAAVVAGALYGIAALSAGGLSKATDEDGLVSARSRTNMMVFGSAAAGAAAVGIGVTAFVYGQPTVGFRGTW